MTFSALASIAAVGTGQRSTLPSSGALAAYLPPVDDADPQANAYALLDSAAASAVVRRGTLPLTPGDPVAVAAADVKPEPPVQVVSILAQLLADETGMIRLSSDRAVVLTEALTLVAAAGMRLPHRTLPVALARRDLRASVRPVLGARGEWLLAQIRAAGLDGPDQTAPDPEDAEVWETGTSEQRIAWFVQARAVDPDRARAAAESTWRDSPAAFRGDVMRVIAGTVASSDEAFLDQCLDDRAEGVRMWAREGLARLPESAYVARMVARARAAVAVVIEDRSGLTRLLQRLARRLRVTLPEPDDAAARDGVGMKLSTPDRINALVAAVPPSSWPSIAGVSVAELTTIPQDEPRWNLVSGLVAATVRNHDAIAATALAAAGIRDPHLVAFLAPEALGSLIHDLPSGQVATVLASLAPHWPEEVAGHVGRHLLSSTSHQLGPEVWTMFARGVPLRQAAGWAQRLRSLGEPEGARPRAIMRDTVSVLTVRALIGDALRPFLPESAWQDPHSGATAPQGGRP
ncbi:MAG: DUF5691 domain-containing protein [Propionibacteriaceae bacterium]